MQPSIQRNVSVKARLSFVSMLLACCWAGPAMANGSTLLQQCQQTLIVFDGGNASNLGHAGECLGRLGGTVDGLSLARATYSNLEKKELAQLYCSPDQGVTNDQSVRIVVKYLKDHPESLHKAESTLIILALIDAFPCDRK